MVILAKILSVFLALIVISKSYISYRNKQESLTMFLFWLLTWVLILFLSQFPIIIEKTNHIIGGDGSGVNTFIGLAFVFMFFIIYRVYIKAQRLEQKLRDAIIKIGLKDLEEK